MVRRSFLQRMLGVTVMAVVPGLGCAPRAPDASVLAEAWALGQESRWSEAAPLLKAWLQANPESVAGHFLYGQVFLHVPNPRFAVAIGEFRLAKALAERAGEIGDLAGFMTAREFEVAFHEKLALAHLRMAYEGIRLGFPERLIRQQLELSLEETQAGLELEPGRSFLLELEETLMEELKAPVAPPGTPRGPIAQGAA